MISINWFALYSILGIFSIEDERLLYNSLSSMSVINLLHRDIGFWELYIRAFLLSVVISADGLLESIIGTILLGLAIQKNKGARNV